MPARLVTSPTGAPFDEPTLLRFLEAARRAPSGFDAQPWRFLYAAAYPRHEQNLARAQLKTRLDQSRTQVDRADLAACRTVRCAPTPTGAAPSAG